MKKDTTYSLLKEIRDLLRSKNIVERSGFELDNGTSGISASTHVSDTWSLTVPKGMTIDKALDECRKHFSVWTYKDDFSDVISDREPTAKYTIEFKANVEADEEHKNKSANELKGKKGITLLERILLELQYFKATGEHLDINNTTLCTGSRYSDGGVPYCSWSSHYGKFCVYACSPDDADSHIRARVAVS